MTVVDIANAAGRAFTATLNREEQRSMGQFMTPPRIARFMARRLVAGVRHWSVRLLEPSAGSGILAAAAVEALLELSIDEKPKRIELLLFELDARLISGLNKVCRALQEECRAAGVELHFLIEQGDFLLSSLALEGQPIEGLLTISNPPFLKLNKATDQRARLHPYAVHGQPNIYALFMAATARLTAVGGRWCFITPRSWMAGAYFVAARRTILNHLQIDSLHTFESRTEGFEADEVLQETVITWAKGRSPVAAGTGVMLTRSSGSQDLDQSQIEVLPAERVIGQDTSVMLAMPRRGSVSLGQWKSTLATYGLEVRTGPVVAFRATEWLHEDAGPGTVPLLWLQHVRQHLTAWPIFKKREHIRASAENAWMLVPNVPMVLMRRFSPKEDARRVTCAAYQGDLPGEVLGLENHLNFIVRKNGPMAVDEVRGLAAYLTSTRVDEHLRALAGSTQINATELRNLPLPPHHQILAIGRAFASGRSLAEADAAVEAVLGTERIFEVA